MHTPTTSQHFTKGYRQLGLLQGACQMWLCPCLCFSHPCPPECQPSPPCLPCRKPPSASSSPLCSQAGSTRSNLRNGYLFIDHLSVKSFLSIKIQNIYWVQFLKWICCFLLISIHLDFQYKKNNGITVQASHWPQRRCCQSCQPGDHGLSRWGYLGCSSSLEEYWPLGHLVQGPCDPCSCDPFHPFLPFHHGPLEGLRLETCWFLSEQSHHQGPNKKNENMTIGNLQTTFICLLLPFVFHAVVYLLHF